MVSLIQGIILSIIQGITEWLPVSSSGHLALIQNFFNINNLEYDVFLHFASIFAVIYLFKKDILELFKKENLRYLLLLIVAMIPIFFAGVFLREFVINSFTNIFSLGLFFCFSGILIYSTKFFKEKKEKINFFDAFFIGLLQSIAIFPGISRSGTTISAGLFKGIEKEKIIKFSFLLSIPVILGASLAEIKFININYSVLIISFILTFLTSIFTIKILLKIIRKGKFYLFGIYNFILGILILI